VLGSDISVSDFELRDSVSVSLKSRRKEKRQKRIADI